MAVDYINQQVEPPCGWNVTWIIREQPVFIEAESYWELVDLLRQRLAMNGEPIPDDLEDVLQRDLCSRCPDGWCKGVEGDREFFSARQVWENGTATLNAIAKVPSDQRVVSQVEAETRAAICETCPKNKRVTGCWPCILAVPLFSVLLPGVSTSKDKKLFGCAICKCALEKKVHVRKNLLAAGLEYPPHCWMNQP